MQQQMEVTKHFPSKTAALNYMQTVDVDRILLDNTGNDYRVVYAVTRSIVDGEVVDREPEIITS